MTKRQLDALRFVQANQSRVTVGPTLRELAKHLGCATNAAQQEVRAFRRDGLVEPNKRRGIILTARGKKL